MVVTRRRASLAASTAVEDQQKAPQAAGAPRRQPVWEGQTLDLTIGDLRRAILAESPWVFERSLLKSGAYLAADLLGIALLYWASTLIDPSPLPRAAKAAAWCLYWFFQARRGEGPGGGEGGGRRAAARAPGAGRWAARAPARRRRPPGAGQPRTGRPQSPALQLRQTPPDLPHYRGEEWDWLRGALATVDRSYGRLLNTLHHHIQDTHVAHHLFSTVPHYNAHEATRIVKPLLGPLYRSDDRPLLSALWADWYVAPDQPGGKVLWFRD
eukprot:scaffold12.g8064.t1